MTLQPPRTVDLFVSGRCSPPITAAVVVHRMTWSAAIIGHRHQAQTPWPRCIGILVQSVRTIKPPRPLLTCCSVPATGS